MALEANSAKLALNWAISRAKKELPASWIEPIRRIADNAGRAVSGYEEPHARRAVWDKWTGEFGGAIGADLSDAQIKVMARSWADDARALDVGMPVAGQWGMLFALDGVAVWCERRGIDAPNCGACDLDGMRQRLWCQFWMRRALRKKVAMTCEIGAQRLGLVSKVMGQPYASDKAVFRRLDQVARNRAALDASWLENEDGMRANLAGLVAKSTGDKTIRRGELMTRIRGCEEYADEHGHAGIFLTLTCPSRFHATTIHGQPNPRHEGQSPRDAQMWLRKTWARVRAKLARDGIAAYGIRVAEPHHDGCPHWHSLLWCDAGRLDDLRAVLFAYWMADCPNEPGADKYRINAKRMDKGGAAGYVAKYISKNITDEHVTEHHDQLPGLSVGPESNAGRVILPVQRVEAWAATWRIRQFQAIGQPAVGVWRELRRIDVQTVKKAGFGGMVYRAWVAASEAADWCEFVKQMGGMGAGKRARIKLECDKRQRLGQYGWGERRLTVGVRLNHSAALCVFSRRRIWRVLRSESADSAFCSTPRTRVNNCTRIKAENEANVNHEATFNQFRVIQAIKNADKERMHHEVGRFH